MGRTMGREQSPGAGDPSESFEELKMPDAPAPTDVRPAEAGECERDTSRIIGDFREKLGLPRGPGFLDDAKAPAVDIALVRGYVERTIPIELAAMVLELSIKYRS